MGDEASPAGLVRVLCVLASYDLSVWGNDPLCPAPGLCDVIGGGGIAGHGFAAAGFNPHDRSLTAPAGSRSHFLPSMSLQSGALYAIHRPLAHGAKRSLMVVFPVLSLYSFSMIFLKGQSRGFGLLLMGKGFHH